MFDLFRQELERHRRRPFLEAVSAACALVAAADGEVSFSERTRLDAVVESLSELRLFDPHEVVNAFDAHVEKLEDAGGDGRAVLLETVAAGTRDDGAADLLLRISVAMSLADGRDSPEERAAIGEICSALGLDTSAADAAFSAQAS